MAAEPTFGPTLPPLTCRTLQVEGCKMPSICELPQGSAPGKYFYRDAAFNVDELLVELEPSRL